MTGQKIARSTRRGGPDGAVSGGARTPAAKRRRTERRRALRAWLFMAPLAAVNIVVVAGPGLASIYYSLTSWTGVGSAHFAGLANYRKMLHDSDFHEALVHNMLWMAAFLTVPMAMGLLGAFLLSRIRRFTVLFRMAFFIPYTVSSVVGANLWQELISPVHGIGQIVGVNFLGGPHLALPAVEVINTWARWGFLVVVFLAAMQGVNPSLYEASELDGANQLRQFWHITLPTIRPTVMFLCLMIGIWSFLVFDWIYILTGGGPGGATDVLSTVLYRDAFENQQAGYAAAIGVVLALLSGVLVLIYQGLRRWLDWEM